MKPILIVYYSRSGHTEKAVVELANTLNSDVENIIDLKNRKGILGFITGGKDASLRKLTSIQSTKYDPEDYELVILASPTWASTLPPAIRTYAEKQKGKLKKVAFLVSQGGGCNGKIYKDLESVTGKAPLATVDISRSEFNRNLWQQKLQGFAQNIQK